MEDPLQYTKPSPTKSGLIQLNNNRGRPLKSNIIKFSPQPKSIISELLKKRIQNFTDCTKQEVPSSVINHIEDDNQEINKCEICSYRWKNKIDLKRHLNVHKQYSCEYPQCTYITKMSSNLIKHKRKHTSEKPFLCDQCTFRTNFINSLTVHRRIHTLERPYACKYCSYKCNSSSNLKKHCHHKHSKSFFKNQAV